MADYDPQASQYCHFAWHQALFALADGQYTRVHELYERDIRPALGQTRTSMYDAASLLWRVSLYGSTTEPLPWSDVCSLAGTLSARPGMAFNDANAALALAGGGDAAALGRLIDGLRALEAAGHPTAGTVVLPLVQGVAAFAQGDYAETIRQVEPVLGQVVRIGGSNAQREVFEDTLLEAYLRAGRYDEAETLLRKRLGRRASARDFFWLGRAQSGAGRITAAQASLAAARSGWARADADSAERTRVERLHDQLTVT
jgi:pentatricopeptide repeat protein